MRPRGATVEAFLDRAHHAVAAEVESWPLGGRALVVIVFRSRYGRAQQAPDLGGDRKGIPLLLPPETDRRDVEPRTLLKCACKAESSTPSPASGRGSVAQERWG
jgi:hypothetical protein